MKDKKAQAISINTMIIIILALFVLVIILVASSGGFAQMFQKIANILHISTATEIDVMVQSCNSYCAAGSKNAFCCEEFKVKGFDEKLTCEKLADEVSGIVCDIDCTQVDC